MLYTNFQGTVMEAPDKLAEVRSHAIDVLRRQSDGKGKLIVGDPKARG